MDKRPNVVRCLFDFLRKPQQSIPTDEMTVSEETENSEDGRKDYTTLGDLARSGHSFFRFSQSQPGRSFEKVYTKFIMFPAGVINRIAEELIEPID